MKKVVSFMNRSNSTSSSKLSFAKASSLKQSSSKKPSFKKPLSKASTLKSAPSRPAKFEQEKFKEEKVDVLVRGLRAVSDFEYELQFALTNKTLARSNFETVFLSASREYLYLSSSLVKEIAQNNGELDNFVPENVERKLIDKVKQMNL